jgi:YQGE family putative transporter
VKFPWHSLGPQARRGLVCHALYWQAVVMAFTFINVYLFRLGHGYRDPALFQIWTNGMIPLGFLLGAALARRRSSAAVYRAGLLAHLALLALVLWLRQECVHWIFLIGSIYGLAAGLYWQGWVLMVVDLSDDGRRDAMLGTQQWVSFVAGLTGAPLAGWFLAHYSDLAGYNYVFVMATLFLGAAWILSLPIQTRPLIGGGSVMRLLRARKPKGFWAMNLSSALMGLMSVSALFLAALIAYESSGNEAGTGGYTFVNAGLGFVSAWWVARQARPASRLRAMVLSSLAVALVTLPLAFNRSFPMILLYGAGMAICLSFYNVPLFSTHLRILSQSPRFHARRADALAIREAALNVGRVAGFSFVMLAVGNVHSPALGGFFVVIALTPIFNTWVMRRHV